ncbi:hypothetical protein L9F63_024157, partial [Diploptera punctata]
VYKNPHCAICNGVPIEEVRCIKPTSGISSRTFQIRPPSLNIILNFVDFEEEIGIIR